eukprot:COSAG05_NODE_1937_length_3810_cov_2.941287_4_plen_96_part_00
MAAAAKDLYENQSTVQEVPDKFGDSSVAFTALEPSSGNVESLADAGTETQGSAQTTERTPDCMTGTLSYGDDNGIMLRVDCRSVHQPAWPGDDQS